MKIKGTLLSIGVLSGTIIGAGVFSLPYIFKSAGIASGIFYLVLGAVVYIIIYQMYAEVILKTDEKHRFVGYVRTYLGKGMSFLSILISIIQVVFVLTIYLILSQSFADLITDFGSSVEKVIIFWVIGSILVFIGAKKIAELESLVTAGIIGIILVVAVFALIKGSSASFLSGNILPDWKMALIPLGPILFSLAGRQAIPDLLKLGGDYKKSIAFGVIIPAIVYLLFVFSVLALSPVVTEDAVSGLIGQLPNLLFLGIIGFFGILSLVSSYGEVGEDVYESLDLDLKMPFWPRFALIIFGPIIMYFAGFQSFIGLVSFVGGIFLALEGLLIIWMWLKATGKKISLPIIALALVFLTALIYEIIK